MTTLRRVTACLAAILLAVAASGALTSCAADAGGASPPQSIPDAGEGVPDGQVDPAQPTKIDGVAVSADGPSPGNLFVRLNDDGSWCKGATLFWNPTVADGVFFTIESISGAGLRVGSGDCGNLPQCLGQDLPASERLECSIRMRPTSDFEEVTPLAMTGSITCPAADVCAQVRDRVADAQEQLWMCSPSWVDDGNECARPTGGG